jgi:preprotein translocase subunit SecE
MGKKKKKKNVRPQTPAKNVVDQSKVNLAEANVEGQVLKAEQNNIVQDEKEQAPDQVKAVKSEQSKTDSKTTKKTKKEKKPNRLIRRLKETGSELKKVTWPTFPKVVKQTGVVLGVVVFFTLILFGFDYLLKFLFELLIG